MLMLKGLNKKAVFAAVITLLMASVAMAGLSGDIRSIISNKTQAKTAFAIRVVNASSGKVLYERNAARPMIPASNMKIITSAAAVHYLGPDYQFKTAVGLLDNSLVVVGGGDPLLGDEKHDKKYGREDGWIFDDIISSLQESKISQVDLALGWGRMSDEAILKDIKISQRNRFYYWQVDEFIIPRAEIERNSANMHMIPSSEYIEYQLDKVKPGQVIRFNGMLVNVIRDDGWRWKSSLSRKDTGGGACEVVWLEDFEILSESDLSL